MLSIPVIGLKRISSVRWILDNVYLKCFVKESCLFQGRQDWWDNLLRLGDWYGPLHRAAWPHFRPVQSRVRRARMAEFQRSRGFVLDVCCFMSQSLLGSMGKRSLSDQRRDRQHYWHSPWPQLTRHKGQPILYQPCLCCWTTRHKQFMRFCEKCMCILFLVVTSTLLYFCKHSSTL